MVYHGVGVGITVYYDGRVIGTDTEKEGLSKPAGNGQVVIGKRYSGKGDEHATVSIDEIKFYNKALSPEEIGNMYQKSKK